MGKVIAIIPARGGSKRIPQKNILNFEGDPLIAYSINYAKANSNIIDEVYVSTNDTKIKEVALNYGAKVIDRPESISGDFEPTITTLQHAVNTVEDDISTVILLQPTNPLRPKNLLKEAYQYYCDNKIDSLFTVSRNHQKLGKVINNKFSPFNYRVGQRSQDLEPLYYENGQLYITEIELIKKNIIFNEDSFPYIVNHKFASVDIDTFEDLEYAKFVLNSNNEI